MKLETIVEPILGLGNEFPNKLFVLHHPSTGRYGCYCHQGVHGLACFSDEGQAVDFAKMIDMTGMVVLDLSFDEAREVAKARPLPVIALMLLDTFEDPLIHYIR